MKFVFLFTIAFLSAPQATFAKDLHKICCVHHRDVGDCIGYVCPKVEIKDDEENIECRTECATVCDPKCGELDGEACKTCKELK